MAEIYQIPEGNGGNNATIPFSIPIGFGGMGNNGFGFGNGGFNSIADLFGLAIIASMFGWGNGGFFCVTRKGFPSGTAGCRMLCRRTMLGTSSSQSQCQRMHL